MHKVLYCCEHCGRVFGVDLDRRESFKCPFSECKKQLKWEPIEKERYTILND